MTVPASQAWYPLGGHRGTTAQSSSTITDPSVIAALQNAQAAMSSAQYEAQQAMAAAQMQATYYSTGTLAGSTLTVTSTSNYPTVEPGFTFASAKSTEAITRSMELLFDWLNPAQQRQLAVNGYFDVIGGHTGIRYRLYPPSNYNVHQLVPDSNETEVKLCFEPKDKSLPKGDIWLCQKLALELDELATLEIANRSATYFG